MRNRVLVIIPNWNGEKELADAISSVLEQTQKNLQLVVVDNGSTDGSKDIIESFCRKDDRVRAVWLDKNYGYTGGVNPGFELAIKEGADYAAPFNNDAVANKDWLKNLVDFLDKHPAYGIAACTILHQNGKTIDSTADQYTIWGLPFPRGRDEPATDRYDLDTDIFGASGGASLYRVNMLKEVGLLDQDFFAYYEDIDLSFRAQLMGWKVGFVPKAFVHHAQGKTSTRLGKRKAGDRSANSFTTKQYMKNLPFIIVKDVPLGLMHRILPRFWLAYNMFFVKSFTEGRGGAAFKGACLFWLKLPKKIIERGRIQSARKAKNDYIWNIMTHDLPPNAYKLKKLRALWWRLMGRKPV